MFLKSLELHGFKSFAHKTTIQFMEGVTIVVGPNGCGKSNVLDAIRWVLGETSAKSLRGQKMHDVVFRGSSSLKPAHFSQVTLTVDNSSSLLKMDQSEVQVARRLFSDGEAEYLINKQKGRMRDVHELFLDTGLGADGYSIIEQGQIGAMVAAKPRERRDIFEEAAGISRYKARREETLRKLVRTEEDLIRLFDIVSEVERSCNSLYRQAKKAERHRRAMKRLHRAQKRLMVLRHGLLSERNAALEAELEKVRSVFEEANAKLANAEAKRAELARLVEDYQRNFQELQQERYDLQQAVNREQRRIESAQQSIAAVQERTALLERELASAGNRVSILTKTIAALQVDVEREQKALSSSSQGNDEAQQRLESLRREQDRVSQEAQRLRHELQSERAKENKVSQDKRISESIVERVSAELANHETLIANVRKESEEAQAEAEKARTEMESRRARVRELKEETARIQAEIQAGDREKNELAGQLDQATRAFNQASSRLEALQELEDSYEGFYRGVQVVMKAAQGGKLNGIVGVLSNVLNVPKQYEVAVEVALGGSLQDIITVSERDAQAAIQLLKQTNSGRATFLPLDLLQSNTRYDHLERIMGRAGVVGLAKKLITYDPKIEPAVERRLGNTLVVEQLRVAIDLQREGIRNRYVSVEGELVDPSGVLTGGSHQSRGLLTRTREIRQLKDDVARLDGERRALADRMKAAKDRLSEAYARAAELQATAHQEQMAEARGEKDFQAAEARAKDRRNALATAEARSVQQRLDLEQHRTVITDCDAGLAQLSQRISERETKIASLENDYTERSRTVSQLSEEISNARANLSGMRERLNALTAKLEELKRDSETAASDRETRTAELTTLAESRQSAATDVAEAELLLGTLIKQRDELEARLSTMQQDNESSLRTAREGIAQVQELQRDRNIKENALREVETQATEVRAQIGFLAQEAMDEFGRPVAEIAKEIAEELSPEADSIIAAGDEEEGEAEEDSRDFTKDDAIVDPQELRRFVNELREKISRMGAVNETAIGEYKTQKERLDFLTAQRDDLIKAKDSLTETIRSLDETTSKLFHEAFTTIRQNFENNFRKLFNGGRGDLILVEEEGHPEPGIDIFAQPPGKNIGGSITLMSGGEKAMTAIALMLSLFQFKPSPICILDEIDAPLDDVNCQRLCDALKEYSRTTQFLIITHNKITMSLADTIYGVTMQEPGISKLVSVKFDKIEESGLLESTGA